MNKTIESKIKKLMVEYPKSIDCEIFLPKELDESNLNQYLMKQFHFEIDLDQESYEFENIYYNSDLRSLMGCLIEPYYDGDQTLNVHLNLNAYVKGLEAYWRNIIIQSNILI